KAKTMSNRGDTVEKVGGGILICDDYANLIGGNTDVIKPSRVITGPNTGLISPVDVAIDMRASGVYLYVADREAKKVSRFSYRDEGNVEPAAVIDTSGLLYGTTPVGLALDARDDSTLDR